MTQLIRIRLNLLLVAAKIFAYLAGVWLLWELAIWALSIPPFLVPPPHAVMKSFQDLPSYYLWHASVTFQEAAFGALIGFFSGFFIGVFLRYGGRLARIVNPIILASQVFPKEALAPLFLVFLGFGMLPKVIISAMLAFFPVAINTAKGLQATPRSFEQLMHVIGATEWERFWRCRLPFSASYILASLRICMTLSVIGAVVGEFVGSSAGLGHVIRAASSDIGMDRIYAALLLLGLQGAAFYGFAIWIETRVLARYSSIH